MPLMPMPPMPTKWIGPSRSGSMRHARAPPSAQAPAPRRPAARRRPAAPAPCACRHRRQPLAGSRQQRRRRSARRSAVNSACGIRQAAPAAASRAAFAVWWSSAAAGRAPGAPAGPRSSSATVEAPERLITSARRAIRAGDVVEEAGELRRDAERLRRPRGPAPGPPAGTAAPARAARAGPRGSSGERRRHDVAEDPRPLAAAHARGARIGRLGRAGRSRGCRSRSPAAPGCRSTSRCARPRGTRPCRLEAERHGRGRTGAISAVGPAEDGVLLVDQHRHARERPRPAPPAPRRSRRRPRPQTGRSRRSSRQASGRSRGPAQQAARARAGEAAGRAAGARPRGRAARRRRSGAARASVSSATSTAAPPGPAPSASAGNMWPAGAAGGDQDRAGHAVQLGAVAARGAAPGQRQQHAHADGQRQQRRAAIADERQRHALGRDQVEVDRHVDQRLQAELATRPVAASWMKRSLLSLTRHRPRRIDEGEQRHERQAGDDAELLGGGGEDEIGMGVGQCTSDALAGPAAEQAAGRHRAQRLLDLVAERGRVEELVHALGEVRQEDIGAASRPSTPGRGSRSTQNQASPATNSCRPKTTAMTAAMPTSGCSARSPTTGMTSSPHRAGRRARAGGRAARRRGRRARASGTRSAAS